MQSFEQHAGELVKAGIITAATAKTATRRGAPAAKDGGKR
jgi:hypothetical protein